MRYTVILEQEADGGYVATVPALPGCVSQGDTRDEVMRNIREAADLYIEDCIAAGDPVPSEAGREYFELKTGTHQMNLPTDLSGLGPPRVDAVAAPT
jgi:predicted RNase H-like HicB family nuclease